MRIERLNENQIRCTLDKTDLEQRQLRLSELAKGSTKAREALHEMIQQASLELDFEVENIPLMVEAIPLSSECLVLVITRIADPEKLEDKLTLLSKLAGMVKNELKDTTLTDIDEDDILEDAYDDYDDGEDIITFGGKDQMTDDDTDEEYNEKDSGEELNDLLDLDPLGLMAPFVKALDEAKQGKEPDIPEPLNRIRLYSFKNLDEIIRVSAFLTPFYKGESVLYKEKDSSCYYLFLDQKETSADYFIRACMIASEFGMRTPVTYAASAYCMEHCILMLEGNALETLNKLNH